MYKLDSTISSLFLGIAGVSIKDSSTAGVTPINVDGCSRVLKTTATHSPLENSTYMVRVSVSVPLCVAPPTSQDYFRYFQKLGGMRECGYEPLRRVPPECVNFDAVQARVPEP
jgi:hypothetical protein